MNTNFTIKENDLYKAMSSPNANYLFNKKTGMMRTWGVTSKDDAELFPGPTIADIEITTICKGVGGKVCGMCYKSNNPNGNNMTLETFKKVFDNLPKTITQIAFGADSQAKANPDIWKIMDYSLENRVVPNITVAEVDDEVADQLVKRCGAVAISRYDDKNICYDSVKKLTDKGMKQINIHMLLAKETYQQTLDTIEDITSDPRLEKLNAIVFLSLKQKGRGENYNILSQNQFNEIVEACKRYDISYGFDSCSSKKYYDSLSDDEYEEMKKYIMPCESTLESSYIDHKGEFYPCSFCEKTKGWKQGIDCKSEDLDFIKDVWHNERTEEFRSQLLESKKNNKYGCRECPIYNI